MTKFTKLSVVMMVGAAVIGCNSAEQQAEEPAVDQAQQVLMIVPEEGSSDLEFMLTAEVGMMKSLLEDAGIEVHVATGSGEPLAAEHTTLTPDLAYGDVDIANYDGIALPCLTAPRDSRVLPPELGNMISTAVADGKPVAAQTGGILTLANLGLLSGKKFAYRAESAASVPQFEDAILSGDGVVEDGNIITSAICPYAAHEYELPDGTTQMTEALIAQLRGEG